MKRQELIRHVEAHGCQLLREGGKHSIYYNPGNNQTAAIRDINDFLACKICRYLGIPDRKRVAREQQGHPASRITPQKNVHVTKPSRSPVRLA